MSWYKNIWKPKSLVVILVNVSPGGREISAVQKSGKAIKLDQTERFDSIEEVIKHFGKSKAYHLHVSGAGVLSRKVETSSQYQEELIINGDPDDFMFSSVDDGVSIAVSFCRKNLIEDELQQFEENKWHLYGVSCGESILFVPMEDDRLMFDYDLEKRGGLIIFFGRSETPQEKTQWNREYWRKGELIAQAVYQQLLEPSEQYTYSESEAELDRRENYRQFSQFKWYGIVVVGAIFLSLVLNYFYQNHLNQRIADLELDLSLHNENLSMLDRLNQEKMRKEQLVLSAGVNSTSFLSFYLDEIGESVPKAIKLEEMIVFPVVGKLKNKRKVEVNQNNIHVLGETKGNEVLDDWMEEMDRFEWVGSVELINYLKVSDKLAEFELMITLE